MKTIVLMGIKHCGKSTLGKFISKKFNLSFFDTDDVILLMTNSTPREIFLEKGEEGFIEAEKNACEYIKNEIVSKKLNAIIATGGGICNNIQAVKILKSFGILVFLKIEERIATSRVLREIKVAKNGSLSNMPAYIAKKNPHTVYDVGFIFHDFFIERERIYQNITDFSIDVSDSSKSKNADKIINFVNS